MKINGVQGTNISNIYKSYSNNSVRKAEGSKESDRIEISSSAKSMQAIVGEESYSIRNIEGVKSSIASGTYNVNAKVLAGKLSDVMKGKSI